MIDRERLLAETFVRHLEWHEEIDSTNSRAISLAGDSACPIPCLVGATHQTAGRGRGTNRWWSGEGTLMFSVLFNTAERNLPQKQWPLFSLVTGLTVAETLETFLPQLTVGLKWPNDVWLNGRKVCGILIEQPERTSGRLVAGLGWNINTSFTSAPANLRNIATSMRDESGCIVFPEDVLVCFLQRWEINLDQLAAGELKLPSNWNRFCVLRNRQIDVSTEQGVTSGICLGIESDGALQVSDKQKIHCCYAGTVRLTD